MGVVSLWQVWLTAVFVGRAVAINASAAPLGIPPSTYWDGDDGWWSTFFVEVGTPGQTLRLLPGTSSSAGSTLWAVIDQGCNVANPDLTNCDEERGGLFKSNESTSWSTEGLAGQALYELNTFEEGKLGLTANAYYGFDKVTLGLSDPSLPSVSDLVIAGFGANDFWLGSLGLSPIPFNFTDLQDPQPSLLSTLFNHSLIPSLSWAYTAGAYYKSPPVLGSLTLGGYDSTRFTPNNVSFAFGADFSRDLLVKLQSITYDTAGSSPLLANPAIDIFIDSLVTHIWLPVNVCQAFEKAFNLTWNETSELYLIDEATHETLLAQNPTFTFSIANGTGSSSDSLDIKIPYAAFDLNVSQPLVESEQRYFPLKQAQNSSQYTLGRVFLQEAYVIADFERGNFSVSQALFPDTSIPQNLVGLGPQAQDTSPDSDSQALSNGAIAGIVIAAVAAIAIAAGIFFWLRRSKSRQSAELPVPQNDPDEKYDAPPAGTQAHELDENEARIRELDGHYGAKTEMEANAPNRHELASPVKSHELPSDVRLHELPSPNRPHEMPSPDVPAVELEAHVPAARNSPGEYFASNSR